MPSFRPILVLATLALLANGPPASAQVSEASGEAAAGPEAKPKPRKPAPPKPAPAKAGAAKPAPAAAPAPIAASSPLWPAGATSVSETYGDWTVSCVRVDDRPACVLQQTQGNARTGKREFAVELKTPVDGRAEGVVLMPFGFAIEPGVTFRIDEQALGKGAPYLACGQDGCVVPISLPTLATDTMASAQAMTVSALKPDAKEPTVVKVPLAGFGPALARAVALAS